ncbi:uncharacterized protein DUF4166 [Fluviicoccus keumensis]|uniref:Uncharacterized protein DUF4166 n=1 Tax=Fluviicoccus keumensis TaxID=1435465 RepID=A0A4Q7ZC28_9GAMM|nr:DUF4166 domain-containing protein [Fluviicoccus keumensis]RZU47515.1 uncharacterized protein DUF4166 [Fluviicoccus keumensis]
MNPSIYRQLLGADYQRLPPEQARFHALNGRHHFQGEADITCGRHPLARLVALVMGLPRRDARVTLEFDLNVENGVETWERHFGPQKMTSVLRARNGLLVERLGAMVLHSRLYVEGDCLRMRVLRARLFGLLPFPLWMMPAVQADETGGDGQVRFTIRVAWAWLGLLVAYQGFLRVAVDDNPVACDE